MHAYLWKLSEPWTTDYAVIIAPDLETARALYRGAIERTDSDPELFPRNLSPDEIERRVSMEPEVYTLDQSRVFYVYLSGG